MSCSKVSTDSVESAIKNDSLLLQFLDEWKKDTTDCIKYRNATMAEYIDNHLSLVDKTKEEVINLLGTPNKVKQRRVYLGLRGKEEDFIYLIYFFEGDCQHIDSAGREDQCWIEVLVSPKNNKVETSSIACN
jgi:hypothetical protein